MNRRTTLLFAARLLPLGLMGPKPPPKMPAKITHHGDDFSGAARLYAEDATGNYALVQELFPRIETAISHVELSDYVNQGILRLRLEWPGAMWLNHLPFVYAETCAVSVQPATLVLADHSRSGNVTALLASADEQYAELVPDQSIELIFEAPAVADSLDRYLVFDATGYYKHLSPDEDHAASAIPQGFEFMQNYPNPFNPRTTFSFGLPQALHVVLEVYNILGQKVATVVEQDYPAGRHQFEWDGRTADGQAVSSGVYLARLTAGTFSSAKKMVVLK